MLNERRKPLRGTSQKKKQNIRFMTFFCQMSMECLLYADPHQGAVEVAAGHGAKTPAFTELTLLHRPVSRWTVNTTVRFRSI